MSNTLRKEKISLRTIRAEKQQTSKAITGEAHMVEILQATVANAPEILALQKLSYLSEAKLYKDDTIPPLTQTIEELIADFGRKTFLKALEDERIIGSVNGFTKDGRCLIGRLMVHPDFQGCGIGSRLMEAIEGWFDDAGSWELFTGELSVKNIRLYERLGYRVVGKEPFPGSRFAVVFMRKTNNTRAGSRDSSGTEGFE
jgi:GNAT superfamily N-acetyltransferase